MMSRESVQPSIQPSRSQSSSSPSERPKGRIRHKRTHHLTSVRPSFLGQMNSIRLPSSDPSPSAKSGICSRIFDRIVRWTELLMLVELETSSLIENLHEDEGDKPSAGSRGDGGAACKLTS
jgi:hypothetical protein